MARQGYTPIVRQAGSARATDTTDTRSNLPTQVKLGSTNSSALGLVIKTLADREEAPTSVWPTTTPYKSPAELPTPRMVRRSHCPVVAPLKSSETPAHQGSVSADVIVMLIGLPPITVPFGELTDVASTTARLPYPADRPIQY